MHIFQQFSQKGWGGQNLRVRMEKCCNDKLLANYTPLGAPACNDTKYTFQAYKTWPGIPS